MPPAALESCQVWTRLGGPLVGIRSQPFLEVVQVCRRQGKSWTQIGEALGMTKQSAWGRFSGED